MRRGFDNLTIFPLLKTLYQIGMKNGTGEARKMRAFPEWHSPQRLNTLVRWRLSCLLCNLTTIFFINVYNKRPWGYLLSVAEPVCIIHCVTVFVEGRYLSVTGEVQLLFWSSGYTQLICDWQQTTVVCG